MNACWFRVPGVTCCFGDELADDGDAAGAGVTGWDGLAAPGSTFAGADVDDLGRRAVLAAGLPRS